MYQNTLATGHWGPSGPSVKGREKYQLLFEQQLNNEQARPQNEVPESQLFNQKEIFRALGGTIS